MYSDIVINNYRVRKEEIVKYIRDTVSSKYQTIITNTTSIDEVPGIIRHSCPQTGIALLNREICVLPTDYGIIEIPYFFCQVCGKLYVYRGFE